MVDIATSIQRQGRIEPLNVFAKAQELRGLKQFNELTRGRIDDQNALRTALQSGAVNELAKLNPQVAGQVFDLQSAQKLQAANRMRGFADQIENSQNPKAMFEILRPGIEQAAETLPIDFSHVGDLSEFDDDTIRSGATKMRAYASALLAGSPFGVIGNTDLPSDFRTALAFQHGDDEFREALLTTKRARQVEELGGVPTDITGGGAGRALSTPEAETEAIRRETAAKTEAGAGGLNLTPGQLAVDQAFSKDFVAWQATGGFADVEKNVSQISGVVKRLEDGENLTGPVIGNTPRRVLASANPEALDALEQVEEVVQRNLRLILGAQFTEKEGERLIARAYNPLLEEQINARRLKRLSKSLTDAAKAKDEASQYFAENGTLAGWKGTLPTISSLSNTIDNEESPEERLARLRREVEALENGQQ